MVPGDYYVVRVRPTGRLLGLGCPPLVPLPLVFFLRSLFPSYFVCSVPMYEYTFAHQYSRMNVQPLGSGDEREDPLCGGIKKVPKRNAVMISPEDGWSKLLVGETSPPFGGASARAP